MFRLMGRLKSANLTVRPDKCHFLKTTVTYLGHIISEKGVEPDPSKVSAVSNFPRPKNRKNIKQFLGLAGYYRRFVKDFAKIAKPLTSLLKADTPWDWTDVQEEAFREIKQISSSTPLLQYPDFNRPFFVTTDASDFAIGGILSQGKIGNDLPIAYVAKPHRCRGKLFNDRKGAARYCKRSTAISPLPIRAEISNRYRSQTLVMAA
ncbi:unnamed protein product [Trichogramma brassicae]|uniref:RNA-directed DNA polymerase n=1 Tax=Trichogramma brassicae TaxID=86971 RepID=A0A6H5J0I6_9HYME|nr:unnamed protein product [Trichogramma brassicae]